MTKCCDLHDICYDTCNSDKEVCDLEFKRCLYRYCESYEKTVGGNTIVKGKITGCNDCKKCNMVYLFRTACKTAAKLLFTGTLTLGCKSYIDAQTNACYCLPSKKDYKSKYHRGDGEL